MREEKYDICIVGGGTAGSTLAYNLDEEIEACVVEKKPIEELGGEPCGNAVHSAWFNDGANPKPEDLDAVYSRVDSIKLHLPGTKMEANLPPRREGLILNKRKFIGESIKSSIDRGMDFIRGEAKPVLKDGEIQGVKVDGMQIEADKYIDASGPNATLRSHLRNTPEGAFFRGYRQVLNEKLEDESWHVFQKDPKSAFWAFPMDGKSNVGGIAFRDGADLKEGTEKMKRNISLEDAEVIDEGFGPVISHKPIPLVYGNLISIGDAGLTVNPITGGGIGPSVKAANLLADSLSNGGNLEDFQDRYMEEVAGGYERNYWLSRLVYRVQRFFWKRAAKWAFENFYGGKPVRE